MHQTVFTLFSTLPFSVGQVKPACLQVKGMSCSDGLICMHSGTCTILLRVEEGRQNNFKTVLLHICLLGTKRIWYMTYTNAYLLLGKVLRG